MLLPMRRYAMTLPNVNAMPTADPADRMFSPGQTDAIFHNDNKRFDIMARLIWAAEGAPACDAACERQLTSLVSAHIKSRNVRNLQAATLLVRAFSELYDAFLASRGLKVHRLTPVTSAPHHVLRRTTASTRRLLDSTSND